MRLNPAWSLAKSRMGRSAFWGSVLLLWSLLSVVTIPHALAHGISFWAILWLELRMAVSLSVWVCGSPLAWEWTGDDRRMAPLTRAALQSAAIALLAQIVAWLQGEAFPESPGVLSWQLPLQVLGYLLLGFVIAHREALKTEIAQMERLSREAHAAQLRAQLSPHALLNALNGLAELVREDVGRAVAGMRDLALVHRHLLEWEERDRITLGEERDLVRRFLAIEALRLEGKLGVSWDWDPCLDPVLVPPLFLQTLAENAVKHGIAPVAEGGEIRLVARILPGALFLEVSNTGRPPMVDVPGGMGLDNLIQRLHLGWGTEAHFRLVREGEWTVAQIRIPGVFP